MAATEDQQMESLLSSFDLIFEDFKSGMKEIEVLKSNCNVEIIRCEALEMTCNCLKQENERMKKLHTESLNNLADELERRTQCQSLKEELKRVTDEGRCKEAEHRDALESLKQEHTAKLGELDNNIRNLLMEKQTNKTTIDHLHRDLAAHKNHIQGLSKRLDQVSSNVESKYQLEIHDLRDCLLVEQEEKNNLHKRFQDLQKELVISKTTLVEQQRDMASIRQIEALKQKLMKLRRENETLKRKLSVSQHSQESAETNKVDTRRRSPESSISVQRLECPSSASNVWSV